jgi:hypothetical protein
MKAMIVYASWFGHNRALARALGRAVKTIVWSRGSQYAGGLKIVA